MQNNSINTTICSYSKLPLRGISSSAADVSAPAIILQTTVKKCLKNLTNTTFIYDKGEKFEQLNEDFSWEVAQVHKVSILLINTE